MTLTPSKKGNESFSLDQVTAGGGGGGGCGQHSKPRPSRRLWCSTLETARNRSAVRVPVPAFCTSTHSAHPPPTRVCAGGDHGHADDCAHNGVGGGHGQLEVAAKEGGGGEGGGGLCMAGQMQTPPGRQVGR